MNLEAYFHAFHGVGLGSAEQSMHLCCQAERAAASGTAHTHTPSQQSSALRIGGLIRVALAIPAPASCEVDVNTVM